MRRITRSLLLSGGLLSSLGLATSALAEGPPAARARASEPALARAFGGQTAPEQVEAQPRRPVRAGPGSPAAPPRRTVPAAPATPAPPAPVAEPAPPAQPIIPNPPSAEPPTPGPGPALHPPHPPRKIDIEALRLEASVFGLTVPQKSVTHLSADNLAAADDSDATLLTALEKFGPTKLLYRFDECFTAERGARLEHEVNVPQFVPVDDENKSGRRSVVVRESQRVAINVRGEWVHQGDANALYLDVLSELRRADPTRLEGVNGPDARENREVTQHFGGGVDLGRPYLLIRADTIGSDDSANVSIIRFRVTRMNPARSPPEN